METKVKVEKKTKFFREINNEQWRHFGVSLEKLVSKILNFVGANPGFFRFLLNSRFFQIKIYQIREINKLLIARNHGKIPSGKKNLEVVDGILNYDFSFTSAESEVLAMRIITFTRSSSSLLAHLSADRMGLGKLLVPAETLSKIPIFNIFRPPSKR